LSSDFDRQNRVCHKRGCDLTDGAHEEDAREWYILLVAKLLDCDFLEFLINDKIYDRVDNENQVGKDAFEESSDTFLLEDLLCKLNDTLLRILVIFLLDG